MSEPPAYRPQSEHPGEFPYTRGIYQDMYRARLWTMRQYAGFGSRRREQPALPLPAFARHHRTFGGLRPADADGHGPRSSAGRGRSGQSGRLHRVARRHGTAVRSDPARKNQHVDDDQLDRGDSAVALRAGGTRPGRRHQEAERHDSERHSEGIHRARHLYLSAAPRHAHHHRSVRLGRRRSARVEHDFDQRLSHSRGRLDRGAGSGVHAGRRHRLCGSRAERGPAKWTRSRRGSLSSSTRTTISSRRSPSSAPRAACGRAS